MEKHLNALKDAVFAQCIWAIAVSMCLAICFGPADAYAEADAQGVELLGYPSTPPEGPASPDLATENPYLYDLKTRFQVDHWGRVVDGLLIKLNNAGLSDALEAGVEGSFWSWLGEHENLRFNSQEAQVLCLFIHPPATATPEDNPDEFGPPSDMIGEEKTFEAWHEWPNCGGILDNMFGANFSVYLVNHQHDPEVQPGAVLEVYSYLLRMAGLPIHQIRTTIEAQVDKAVELNGTAILTGADGDLDLDEEAAGQEEECYTASTNVYNVTGCGVLCTVTRIIIQLLNSAATALVNATVENDQFQTAVISTMILYIVIYGAMVTLGLVNIAVGDAVVRVAKLGVVALMLSSSTVNTLFELVRCFFIEGTTYLINGVTSVGLAAVVDLSVGFDDTLIHIPVPEPLPGEVCAASFNPADSGDANQGGPLVVLEALLSQLFSAHMFLTFISLIFSSLWGPILAIFLFFGVLGLMLSILGAVTIYLTALIGQYLLLALMPVFIAFVLFDRTRYLFEGWVNQLVSYSLTPIFLFAFISLFIVVIESALAQILDTRICWLQWRNILWVFDIFMWQFSMLTANVALGHSPFGFYEVFILILLVYLMREFEKYVEDIARNIGNSYFDFGKTAKELQQWFKGKGSDIRKAAKGQLAEGVQSVATRMRGGVKGHDVDASQTGQKGVSGPKGSQQQSRQSQQSSTPRKGGPSGP